jgi:superfamily II DNA or RNA helicase
VSCIQGDQCDTSGDVVLAMLQTLVSRKHPPSTFREFGLVVVDECHHIGAQVFSSAMFGLAAPYTLGLSATPDRKDGLGKVVTWFLGDVVLKVKRENQQGTTVRTVKYDCQAFRDPPPVNRRGDVCFTSVVTALVENEERTALVATEAVNLARTGRDVLVLSHRRAHCTRLAELIAAAGVQCETYLGGDKTVPDSKVIVATYALTAEGFDEPRLTALVLATPASDVEQSCGRVMRGGAGLGSVIVDVADQWGVCFAQHAKRRALYRRSGFVVQGPDVGRGQTQDVPETYAFLE